VRRQQNTNRAIAILIPKRSPAGGPFKPSFGLSGQVFQCLRMLFVEMLLSAGSGLLLRAGDR
jgi:hypothetical protein